MRGIGSEVPFNRDMERQVHPGNARGSLLQDAVTVWVRLKPDLLVP
jgi:hypothetical protein